MTLEQIQTLTDDEIRVRVAELMGFTEVRFQGSGSYVGFVGKAPRMTWSGYPIANYPADLNACASFEATLTDKQWEDYGEHICDEFMRQRGDMTIAEMTRAAFGASARQRCEAFLATMGKDTP